MASTSNNPPPPPLPPVNNAVPTNHANPVEPVIKGHRLHYLLTNPQIPPRYASLVDHNARNISSEFLLWEQQDELLLLSLQSTFSGKVLPRLVGRKSS
ncbi:hypothetical protein GYH30_012519 [Glycine max]|uniref:Uncharacterized protein n=1 Tax=Glycine max TaxID=3847 RepID=A0A0R0JUR7_SOYBN|nr:hypothetical protein GYH30_012519 [Glycine max]